MSFQKNFLHSVFHSQLQFYYYLFSNSKVKRKKKSFTPPMERSCNNIYIIHIYTYDSHFWIVYLQRVCVIFENATVNFSKLIKRLNCKISKLFSVSLSMQEFCEKGEVSVCVKSNCLLPKSHLKKFCWYCVLAPWCFSAS